MAFPVKLLNEGEKVVLDLRPHWWFFAGPVATVVALTVLAILVAAQDLSQWVILPVVAVMLVAVAWLAVRYARWVTTNFVVTSDRLIYRHGVLSKSGIEVPLERVNTILFNQSLFERLLGAGDLVIESAGERGQQHFSDIRKPSLVQNVIYQQIEDNENRKFDRVRSPGGGGPSAGHSIPEQIEQLDQLYRRGVISRAEFEAKKTQLLDRM